MSFSNSNHGNELSTSVSNFVETQVDCLEGTAIVSDNFSLVDVLQKFKDQVRFMASQVSQLDQFMNLVENPPDPSSHLDVFKAKQNIINNITHLLKEIKPIEYPGFQSLCSVKLLKMYEKLSSECKLLLNTIKHDNDNMSISVDRFNKLTTFITDFQQEVDNIIAQNTLNEKVEREIAREFKECKSDLYALLLKVDPSSTLKEIMSLLLENGESGDEDGWVNIEDLPHLSIQCQQLKKNGFVLQNEQNKYLYKLNLNI